MKYCLKTENDCLKTQTKHPLNAPTIFKRIIFLKEEQSNAILWSQYFKLIANFWTQSVIIKIL